MNPVASVRAASPVELDPAAPGWRIDTTVTLGLWDQVALTVGANVGIYRVVSVSPAPVLERIDCLDVLGDAGLPVLVREGAVFANRWLLFQDGAFSSMSDGDYDAEQPVEAYRVDADGADWQPATLRAQMALDPQGVVKFTKRAVYDFYSPVVAQKRGTVFRGAGKLATEWHFHGCHGFHPIYSAQPGFTGHGGGSVLRDMTLRYVGALTDGDIHGCLLEGPGVKIDGVQVFNFPGNGFLQNGDIGANGTNANACTLIDCRAYGCGLSGYQSRGGDSNASLFLKCDATANGARHVSGDCSGFDDNSLIGNYYEECTSATNYGGSASGMGNAGGNYRSVKPGNASTFRDCYSEGSPGGGSDAVAAPSIVDGGTITSKPGLRPAPSRRAGVGTLTQTDTTLATQGAAGVGVRVARDNTDEVLNWFSSADPVGYKLVFGPNGFPNAWALLETGAGALCALELTFAGHTRGAGFSYFRRGLITNGVRVSAGTTATRPTHSVAVSDIWKVGDRYLNSAPASGQPECWYVSAVAGDGTLTWGNGPLCP